MQNPNIFTSFSPRFFLTIFLVKSRLSTAKKSKTTTFSRVFHPKLCLKNCSTFSCHCTRVCLSFKASAPFLSLFLPLLPKPILSKTLISPMLFRISTFEKHFNFPFSSFRFGILGLELIVALFDEFLILIGWYCLRLANQ